MPEKTTSNCSTKVKEELSDKVYDILKELSYHEISIVLSLVKIKAHKSRIHYFEKPLIES